MPSKEIFVSKPTFLQRAFSFRNILYGVILAFGILTFFAKLHPYFNFDLQITLNIQKFNPSWFDFLMREMSFLGSEIPVIVIVAVLGIYGYMIGKRKAPIMLVVSTGGGFLVSQIIKIIIQRPRPDPTLIHQVGTFLHKDSFPSGHVMGAVSVYGFLLFIAHTQLKMGIIRNIVMIICILMMVLMGFSRIYLGAHWFSDVLGAYLIGFVWLSVVVFFYHKLKPEVKPK